MGIIVAYFFGEIKNKPLLGDIPGIIFLKRENTNLLYKKEITYQELISKGNLIKSKIPIPENSVFHPVFSAKVISELKINLNNFFK